MTQIPSILDLLQSGVHFGHQTSRWHPKMKPFIFGVKNGVHVIDLEKTQKQLEKVDKFIEQIVSNNGTILFLGTKRQVKKALTEQAVRCKMPYINERWIGGFLTNFPVVIKLTKKYNQMVKKRDSGEYKKYTKKEQLNFTKQINKLEADVFGVKDMEKLPQAIFMWDVKSEKTAVKESQHRKIPIIGICDTNTNPTGIDYVIPTNDDGTKAIELILKFIADSVIAAQAKIPQDSKSTTQNKDTLKK